MKYTPITEDHKDLALFKAYVKGKDEALPLSWDDEKQMWRDMIKNELFETSEVLGAAM